MELKDFSCLHSLKSVGKVLQTLVLQQQQKVIVGLDLGGRKQNLHFNVHVLFPPGNSPCVEPPKEITVLLARVIHAGQLRLPWSTGVCACGCCCSRVEALRG